MSEPMTRVVTQVSPLVFVDVPGSQVPMHYVPVTFAGIGLCWVDPEQLGIECPEPRSDGTRGANGRSKAQVG
jgi:hypothetical protein